MGEFTGGDDEPRLTARQAHIMDEQLRAEQEAREEEQADDDSPVLCRTCHEPIDGNGDEDYDQCAECRYETP